MPQPKSPQTAASLDSPSDPTKPDPEFLRITAAIPDTVTDEIAQDGPGQPADAKPTLITAELVEGALSPTFAAIFNMMAKMRGDVWALREFENRALVKGWSPIVQILLSKLGSETEILLAAALIPTMAIVTGKVAQEGIKRASLTANIRTPKSEASSSSLDSAAPARPPEPSNSYATQFD